MKRKVVQPTLFESIAKNSNVGTSSSRSLPVIAVEDSQAATSSLSEQYLKYTSICYTCFNVCVKNMNTIRSSGYIIHQPQKTKAGTKSGGTIRHLA